MIRAAALAAVVLALAGCEQSAGAADRKPTIVRVDESKIELSMWAVTVAHDDKRAVTCWISKYDQSGGISCLPDWMLTSGERGEGIQ